jgi:hypothetical protein
MADKGRVYSTAVSSLLESNRTSEASELYHRAVGDGATFSREGHEVVMRGGGVEGPGAVGLFSSRSCGHACPKGENAKGSVEWRPERIVVVVVELRVMNTSMWWVGRESRAMEGKALWRPIQACARAGLLKEAATLVSDYYLNGRLTSTPIKRLSKASGGPGRFCVWLPIPLSHMRGTR